jgi:hypothetical protein
MKIETAQGRIITKEQKESERNREKYRYREIEY